MCITAELCDQNLSCGYSVALGERDYEKTNIYIYIVPKTVFFRLRTFSVLLFVNVPLISKIPRPSQQVMGCDPLVKKH